MFKFKFFVFSLILFVISKQIVECKNQKSSSGSGKLGQNSQLLNLTSDILEEIIVHLPLRELFAVGKTCRELYVLALQFYFDNIKAQVFTKAGNIYRSLNDPDFTINLFSPCVQSIVVKDGGINVFHRNIFVALDEIEFYDGKLNGTDFSKINLPFLRKLKFRRVNFIGDLFDMIRNYEEKLIHLYVHDSLIKKSENIWLTKTYPKLKHFESLYSHNFHQNDEFTDFLLRHKHIKHLSTTIPFILNHIDWIVYNSSIETLSILHDKNIVHARDYTYYLIRLDELRLESTCFKQLHLYVSGIKKELKYPPRTFRLVKLLYIAGNARCQELNSMINVEKLFIENIQQIHDFEDAINKLKKLKYIRCKYAKIDEVLILIRSLPKLIKLQILELDYGEYFKRETKILQLSKLNAERSEANSDVKLTLYVDVRIYSATKAARKLDQFSLIEIKRYDAYLPSLDFCFR